MHWQKHFNEQTEIFSDPVQILDFNNPNLMRQIHEIIAKLVDLDCGKILDCGCGLGDLELIISNIIGKNIENLEIYCIDIAEKILLKCKERLRKFIPNARIEFSLMDLTNLGFKEETFNLCIASEALQYVDPFVGIDELLRVTRKGGTIVLSIPNKLHPIIKKAELRNQGRYKGIDLNKFKEKYLEKVEEIYVRPLIFAKIQKKEPYINNEFKVISLISEAEMKVANRFIIKIIV